MFSNENIFIEGLRYQPETYKTILKHLFNNKSTITNTVRKKMSKLIKFNIINYSILDGTRFGERIFYHPEKQYFIFTIYENKVFKYYYCFDVVDVDDIDIALLSAYTLNHNNWLKIGDIIIKKVSIRRWF